MPIEITMPRLSDTMEVGTILSWHVHAGDVVVAGDLLADIETDKATMELQSFDDGTIEKLIVEEGQQVSVGTIIATILEEDEVSSDSSPESVPKPEQTTEPTQQSLEQRSAHTDSPRVSPIARRLAEEHGLDLQTIQGTGPSGRIIKRDVLQIVDTTSETTSAANTTKEAPSSAVVAGSSSSLPMQPLAPVSPWQQDRTVPLSNIRQVIAKKLVESKQTIPHYQVTMTFDMDPLLEMRKTLNEQLVSSGVKLSVNDFSVEK